MSVEPIPRTFFSGGCHCGDVRFEVDGPLDASSDLLECDCSVCQKKGFLHWIVPPSRFRLLTPRERLSTYTFGTQTAKHTFCARCGIHAFYTPRSHPDHVDVNVRCLDDVDPSALPIRAFGGRADWEGARRALADPR